MTISKDRVKPSPMPDSWKLAEIFATGIVIGSYLAMMTVIFFWAAYETDFFPVRVYSLTIYYSIPLLYSPAQNFPKAFLLRCTLFGSFSSIDATTFLY